MSNSLLTTISSPGVTGDSPLSPRDRAELLRRLQSAHRLSERVSQAGVLGYLHHLTINAADGPRPFREVAEPWQWALAGRLAPAVESLSRIGRCYEGPQNFWFVMPRGHDKTSSLGRLCNWLLGFTGHYVKAVACARDREQAAFLAEAMEVEARLNPWLAKRLSFSNYKVEGNKGSVLNILSADAKGSYGDRPDAVIVDELTHWDRPDLWQALWSGRQKRKKAIVLIISNAGVLGTWQHDVLLQAQKQLYPNGSWYVYQAPGPIASYMNMKQLALDRQMLLPSLARRVLDNQWIDPNEDSGFVTLEDVMACEQLGRDLGLGFRPEGEPGKSYVAVIDYGPVRDRTALAVCHREGERLHVDRLEVLEGKNSPTGRVPVSLVEAWVDRVRKNFDLGALVVDPYQLEGSIQNWEGTLPVVRFESRAGKSNYEWAQLLRTLILNRRVAWYPGAGDVGWKGRTHTLVDEFRELVVKPMSYGFKVCNAPGFFDDRVTVLGMAAVSLFTEPLRKHLHISDNWF